MEPAYISHYICTGTLSLTQHYSMYEYYVRTYDVKYSSVYSWDIITIYYDCYSPLPPSPSPSPSPPSPTDPQPAGRLCSRIEALKKELRVGLGKELFAKAYAVLEGGLDTEHEEVGVSGGASLSFLINTAWVFLLYHSTHKL